MKQILESAPSMLTFSIIINKVEPSLKKKWALEPDTKNQFMKGLCAELPRCTDSVHVIEFSEEFHGAENALWQNSPSLDALKSFVWNAPAVWIDQSTVAAIQHESYEIELKAVERRSEEALKRQAQDYDRKFEEYKSATEERFANLGNQQKNANEGSAWTYSDMLNPFTEFLDWAWTELRLKTGQGVGN